MVETVIKAREIAERKEQTSNRLIIAVPSEKLSAKHHAMSRNISGGGMFFVDDEVWRKKNMAANPLLPFLVISKDEGREGK